ncbi:MAG TPA: sigma-70 family RNA polymerase sigma factor [Chitinophagaceae bacterium]|nr:sigma-70 family RNA polymerase sigma factor [Chitinophagaceae bacterium]
MPQSIDEIWLWNEVRNGSTVAFHNLYMDHYDRLYRYGIYTTSDKFISSECINETFGEIWLKRRELPVVKKVGGYIFIIFKRKLFGKLKEKKNKQVNKRSLELDEAYQPSYEDILIESQEEEAKKWMVKKLLKKLTPRQKEFINLRYFEGLSIEQIANKKEISARTIYNTLHAAIKKLRTELFKKV